MSDDLPTPREELNRKTVEHLQFLVDRAENGRMTKQELALAAHTVWHVTSGLVDDDISELASQCAQLARQQPIKRHFAGKGTVRTIAWFPDRPGFVVATRALSAEAQPAMPPIKRDTDVGLREQELETVFAGLRKAGYQEL